MVPGILFRQKANTWRLHPGTPSGYESRQGAGKVDVKRVHAVTSGGAQLEVNPIEFDGFTFRSKNPSPLSQCLIGQQQLRYRGILLWEASRDLKERVDKGVFEKPGSPTGKIILHFLPFYPVRLLPG